MNPIRIGIIGGGPGGLMTAYRLERRATFPCEISIYEASGRTGGKILTPHFASEVVRYEAGAAELYDYSRLGPDPLRELVEELGLRTRSMWGDAVIIGERVLSDAGAVRAAYGEDTARNLQRFARNAAAQIQPGDYYEPNFLKDNADPLAGRTFASVLDECDDEKARRFLEVAVHSDVATEPHKTNALYGLQNFLMMEQEYMRLYSIEGGLERLPRELAARLQAKTYLRQPVVAVERDPSEDVFVVHSRSDDEEVRAEFDFVVVALPVNWIPFVEWRGSVLARAMRDHVAHYSRLAHYLRVSLLYPRPFWRERVEGSYFMVDALGGACVYDETSRENTDHHGVLGWLLAGDAALTFGNLDESALVELVARSLPRVLGDDARHPLEGRVHRWLGAVSALPGGFPQREPDSRHVPEPLEHPWLFTVGDYLFDATLNGTLDSADTVVDWILEEVAEQESELVLSGVAPPASSEGVAGAERSAESFVPVQESA